MIKVCHPSWWTISGVGKEVDDEESIEILPNQGSPSRTLDNGRQPSESADKTSIDREEAESILLIGARKRKVASFVSDQGMLPGNAVSSAQNRRAQDQLALRNEATTQLAAIDKKLLKDLARDSSTER